MTLQYSLPNKGVVVIHNDVIKYLSQKKQKKFQFERGGILFAQFEEGKTLVSLATGPYKNDIQLPFQYKANKKTAQIDIERKFQEGLHYIGEWHTHPQKKPQVSSQDLKAIKCCFDKSEHTLDYFILIIVGQSSFPEGLWVGVSNGFRVNQLDLQPEIETVN